MANTRRETPVSSHSREAYGIHRGGTPLPNLCNVLKADTLRDHATLASAAADTPHHADTPKITAEAADHPHGLFRDICERAECPVSVDLSGNAWCWCRTCDVRDFSN
jgi:hypothetical protein